LVFIQEKKTDGQTEKKAKEAFAFTIFTIPSPFSHSAYSSDYLSKDIYTKGLTYIQKRSVQNPV
jgi:hypothetical protein